MKMLLVPCFGAATRIRYTSTAVAQSAYVRNAGAIAKSQTCCTLASARSGGACSTIVTLPLMQSAQPTQPNALRRSPRNASARSALTMMLSAPSGVTRIAGANA